jgi:hypothetical protein
MTPLQQAMVGNAVFSSISATSFLFFRQAIAANSNIPAVALAVIAVGLLGFAALLLYGALGRHIKLIGRWAVILDWAWVIGSALALILPLSNLGRIGLAAIAVLVTGFAMWQQRGLNVSRGL